MSTTVIFSNMGDTDTKVLTSLWMGLPDTKVVMITRYTMNALQLVNEAIAEETDTLIMCGHGCGEGLFNPRMNDLRSFLLIGAHNKHLIKAKNVIGIWCHAKDFAERYGVKGFWSSMFISNINEAYINGIYSVSKEVITLEEIVFCLRVNYLIQNKIPMNQWIKILINSADFNNSVVRFNYSGLKFYETAPTPQVTNHYYRYGYGFKY